MKRSRPINPETLIKEIREAAPYMETVFSRGSCWKLHKILKMVFPDAEPYYLKDLTTCHVITKIKGHFYDIAGKVDHYKTKILPFNEENFPESWKQKDEWVCNLSHLVNIRMDKS